MLGYIMKNYSWYQESCGKFAVDDNA